MITLIIIHITTTSCEMFKISGHSFITGTAAVPSYNTRSNSSPSINMLNVFGYPISPISNGHRNLRAE